jgi:hypothetical protein
VEEPVFKKIAPQFFLSITSSNIVIIINQKPFQESKEEKSLRVYKSRRRKKIFILKTEKPGIARLYLYSFSALSCYPLQWMLHP